MHLIDFTVMIVLMMVCASIAMLAQGCLRAVSSFMKPRAAQVAVYVAAVHILDRCSLVGSGGFDMFPGLI